MDTQPFIEMIQRHSEEFYCPFSDTGSYLNIFEGGECAAEFFYLQECNYEKEKSRDAEVYLKYMMRLMQKEKKTEKYNFLKKNYKKLCIELNEKNFEITKEQPHILKAVESLNSLFGQVCRARLVKLPAKSHMPYHRDETGADCSRLIFPLITNTLVRNTFKNKSGEVVESHFSADGSFYYIGNKIEHAVFNDSEEDRYSLVFTALGINDISTFDKEFHH